MIRQAEPLDLLTLVNMCKRYVEEEVSTTGHHSSVWEPDYMVGNMLASLDAGAFLRVAVLDGKVVGFLWAVIGEMAPWNPQLVANDILFYVEPEYRGSTCGLRLVKEYTQWANSFGCVESRLSLASGINMERTGLMFERLGYRRFGTVYNHKY